MKRWALRAIEAGVAVPHRLGLSDYVLVFEEHRNLLDGSVPLSEHFRGLRARPECHWADGQCTHTRKATLYPYSEGGHTGLLNIADDLLAS